MDPGIAHEKQDRLKRWLRDHRPLLIAFSGGVDSTYLLAMARRVLGEEVTAATACGGVHSTDETAAARALANRLSVVHECFTDSILDCQDFVRNGPERCYVCKQRLFVKLKEIAAHRGIAHIAHGATVDDGRDYRPGHRAAREAGILAPLEAVGLEKSEIRVLSRELGLETWNQPAQPCLATRIAYGIPITAARLAQVAEAEAELRRRGVPEGRVRHHGDIARIEVAPAYFDRLMTPASRIGLRQALQRLGFTFVALDLEGYVTGSMNRSLQRPQSNHQRND
ncbi:MAG: ATP-dependent sacrificial sulfur transferase LarE [Desulfobacteraceae bacterium]|nr:ATP-dependent sacrificial sulfur transferase LarE [Desulfobacteraceae bacterium]